MTRLPRFTHIWKETLQEFQQHNKLMISIGLIAGFPMVALKFLPLQDTFLESLLLSFGGMVLAIIWFSFISLSIYAKVAHPEINSIQEAIRLTSTKVNKYLTTQILQGIIITVPYILTLTIIMMGLAFGLGDNSGLGGAIAIYGIGTVAGLVLLIPFSFLAYRFMFTGFIVFSDNTANIAALRTSYEMSKGRVWEIWGKMFGYTFFSLLGCIGLGILQAIVKAPFRNTTSENLLVISSIFDLIKYIIFIPLSIIFIGVIYKHIKSANSTQPTA